MTRSRAASGLLGIGKVKKKKMVNGRRAFDWEEKVLRKGTDGWEKKVSLHLEGQM